MTRFFDPRFKKKAAEIPYEIKKNRCTNYCQTSYFTILRMDEILGCCCPFAGISSNKVELTQLRRMRMIISSTKNDTVSSITSGLTLFSIMLSTLPSYDAFHVDRIFGITKSSIQQLAIAFRGYSKPKSRAFCITGIQNKHW